MQILWPIPRDSDSGGLEWDPSIFVCNNCPGVSDAGDPWTSLSETLLWANNWHILARVTKIRDEQFLKTIWNQCYSSPILINAALPSYLSCNPQHAPINSFISILSMRDLLFSFFHFFSLTRIPFLCVKSRNSSFLYLSSWTPHSKSAFTYIFLLS